MNKKHPYMPADGVDTLDNGIRTLNKILLENARSGVNKEERNLKRFKKQIDFNMRFTIPEDTTLRNIVRWKD